LFVVLEGNECTGKTTQGLLLQKAMTMQQGQEPLFTVEPSKEGPIGRFIRKDLLAAGSDVCDKAVQLAMFADRADHIKRVVLPALKEGKTVISDRYNMSTIVYGYMAGLDLKWLVRVGETFLKPDVTILLRISPEVAAKRLADRPGAKERFEKPETIAKLEKAYEEVGMMIGAVEVDADRGIGEVAQGILKIVNTIQIADRAMAGIVEKVIEENM